MKGKETGGCRKWQGCRSVLKVGGRGGERQVERILGVQSGSAECQTR